MSAPKISSTEQRLLRDRAKSEIERLEKYYSDPDVASLLDEFKFKFNLCESSYKIILAEHQRQKGKKTKQLQISMRQVPAALKFAGYQFERELLKKLFGANSERGKTVKELRNAITHGISEKAIDEIKDRKDELFGYMDTFLLTIKNFDEE